MCARTHTHTRMRRGIVKREERNEGRAYARCAYVFVYTSIIKLCLSDFCVCTHISHLLDARQFGRPSSSSPFPGWFSHFFFLVSTCAHTNGMRKKETDTRVWKCCTKTYAHMYVICTYLCLGDAQSIGMCAFFTFAYVHLHFWVFRRDIPIAGQAENR